MKTDDSNQHSWNIPNMLLGALIMEAVVLLHSLWREEPYVMLLLLWIPLAASLRGKYKYLRFFIGLALGCVLGEAIGYLWVVPIQLIRVCIHSGRFDVTSTYFLRLFTVLLLSLAFLQTGCKETDSVSPEESADSERGWGGVFIDGVSLLLGFLFVFAFAMIIHRGPHPRVDIAIAQQKALAQLGPDYADYNVYVKEIHHTIRVGQYETIHADLLAYQPRLHDVQEVSVSWRESWNGSR